MLQKKKIKDLLKKIDQFKEINLSYSSKIALLAILYFLTGKFGLTLNAVNVFAAPVWFPTGLALTALFIGGYRLWPGVFLGAFFVNLLSGAPFFSAFGMGMGNVLEAVIGIYILKRFGFHRSLEKVHDVIILTLIAGPLSALVSSSIGVTSMLLGHVIVPEHFMQTWFTWWIGDTLSDIIVAPFLLIWTTSLRIREYDRSRLGEGTGLAALIAVFSFFVFNQSAGTPPIAYAIFPPLIWAALRFTPRYSITAIFFISILAIVNTANHTGLFANVNLSTSLIYLQIYLGVISVSSLIFGAVISERNQLEKRKDDFLSLASHELKTPVTSMKIYVDILQHQLVGTKDKKALKIVQNISGQTDRLKVLVSDLLDVSRIGAGKLQFTMEEFDLDVLIKEVREGIQASTENHTIIYKNKTKIMVYGDTFRLYQVLTNLLTNAIKYSPHGGDVTIKIVTEDRKVIVSVTDTGIGIDDNQKEKVFDRLYQAGEMQDRTFPGLGMGLFISKEIIKRHGGEIWVDSEKDKGSTFYFTLPQRS
jgi:signal transduction histidine kinase